MSDRIGEEVRALVVTRAEQRCEYCLIHENDTFLGCEVDHIISLKHAGTNDPANLAFACVFCNRHKGTDIASIKAKKISVTPLSVDSASALLTDVARWNLD